MRGLKPFVPLLACMSLLAACAPVNQSRTLTPAQVTALYQAGDDAHRAGDFATAFKDFTRAAQAGHAQAQVWLGQMYQSGQGVSTNYAQARFWYEKAAAQGNSGGLLDLGLLYRLGLGMDKNPTTALKYFQAASDAGDLKAPRYVDLSYTEAGDFGKAFTAYGLGAARGDITSQFYLGRAYELGQGTTQDYAQAMKWYAVSATRGDSIASDGLVGEAGLYERGLGVAQDINKALALYKQAAGLGNVAAKTALQRLSAGK